MKKEKHIIWSIVHFDDLSTKQLYDLLELRTKIFVVEQDCPYQEVDDKDLMAFHVLGYTMQGKLIAVARILPKGLSYNEISFGRVAIDIDGRGSGLGHELTTTMISFIENRFNTNVIRISAQSHLNNFYETHGFKTVSEEYLEDDIPHFEMLRSAN